MNPETIRIIDFWIGKPACAALTFLRRLGPAERSADLPPPRKIMFIKLIEQGATVLAYGAILRAIQKVGRNNVYFCVFEDNQEILRVLDVIPPENIFTVRNRGFMLFLRDILALLGKTRKLGIDTTIDMEFFTRAPAILAFFSGAKRRIGYHRFNSEVPYRGDLMTHRVQYSPYLHAAVSYRLLVEAADLDPEDLPQPKIRPGPDWIVRPKFIPDKDSLDRVRSIISAAAGSFPAGPIVILNPNAGDMLPIRKWPEARFIELGKKILEAFPEAAIAVTGSPSERAAAEEICAAIASPRAFSLAGKTKLRDLFELYTLSHILITNDSGPAHFASMTDINSIVLYGPETPLLFGPISERGHAVFKGLGCSPCVNVYNHRFTPCKVNRCMLAITVDEVFALVEDRLMSLSKRQMAKG
ncbi:MAG TPA: glycosyltransferase family 9 protein [Syntrophales bacterium]|nr:glycosyltransferase family 9 protein [Syntrophales bacterium]